MTKADRIQRMHALLDGEATPVEAREIESLIERDAQVRSEFEELKRLFAALESVPQPHSPEGLVAAVTTAYAQRDQLSSGDGVIRDTGIAGRGRSPERSIRRPPAAGAAPFHGGGTMITSKRRLWIGGIAVALMAIAVSSLFIEFPKSGDDTVGTITPAQRYRAPQPTPGDIKLADPGTLPAGPRPELPSTAENVARDSAKDSARDVARDIARDSARDSARDAARDIARDSAKDSAKDMAKDVARDSAKDSAKDMAKDLARDSAKDSAKDMAKDVARDSAKDSARDAARDIARDSARDSARDVARDTARDSAKNMAKDAAKDSAKNTAKDMARDMARDSAKDAAKDSAKDMARDSAKVNAQSIAK